MPSTSQATKDPALQSARQALSQELATRLYAGLAGIALLIFGVGGWAATAPISAAVVAPGTLVVETSVKRVQHREGGIVSHIFVGNGDNVSAGDIVIRLDGTQLRSALAIVTSQIRQLQGRRARLQARRDNKEQLAFPTGFTASSEEAATIAKAERRLHTAHLVAMRGRKAQLTERIQQLEREIEGYTAQRDAKTRELKLVREEESRVAAMHDRQLIPVTRLLAIKRDTTRVAGELGAFISRIASLEGQINETRLQILSIDEDAAKQAQEELRTVEARLAELEEQRFAAEDRLRRTDIRAPQAGIVHELAVHTVGGVIAPGEQIMLIVPQNDALHVDATVARGDIDQIHPGQQARLRFAAFNQQTTPELKGIVLHISADAKTNTRTGVSYYVARIALASNATSKLHGLRLVPGMPVEAFIETKPRTVLSYLVKPVTDNLNRTFRED